ncbi:MAG: hypothetical protein WC617_12390 [Rhodanobacter sp.]|jgi:hypothetical protein
MRPASEFTNPEALAKSILSFAQGYRSLLVPQPKVLADTVMTLGMLVPLSDKVLPLKSYFNMVQTLQRSAYMARALSLEVTRDMPVGTPDEVAVRDARARDLENEVRQFGITGISHQFAQLVDNSHLSDDERQQVWRRREERLAQDAQQHLCTEDVFMLACAFLDLDVAKQGSIYYLKGESPDFKETKKNRNPIALKDGKTLKSLSSGLGRPTDDRGTVERGQIESGYNHLAKLNQLHNTMLDVVRWIKEGERMNPPVTRTKVMVRKHFGDMSHTDYERIMSMARREGLISFRNRVKDPSNNYTLRQHNHEFIVEMSKKIGRTPQKTLDDFIEDMRKHLDKMAALKAKKKTMAGSGD